MKKEPKSSHNIFSNSDLYRKENVHGGSGAHVIASKSNLAFNRNNNNNQYQSKLKGNSIGSNGGGQVLGIQEGYFPPGFYPTGNGKHPSAPHNIHHPNEQPLFTKHELEFHQQQQQQQQKGGNMALGQQQFPPQFHNMHEFEHHNNLLKNDVNHKMITGGIGVHGRVTDFHQNQMYYNENNAQNSHHNQYYPNDFDIPGGGGGSDSANSSVVGYFDPKSQAHYYDMNYHGGGGNGNDYSEMYGPNAIINENCENFASFQQYYDHHQQQQQQTQSTPQQQNLHHPNYHSHVVAAAASQQNIPPGAYIHHQHHHQQQQQQQNFPPPPHHHHHHSNVNSQIHGNANLTENSNSSSDFNFLSNLNDFAPEYYQLS